MIYVMRHGETVWNAIGKIQGRSQNRLSKNGIKQVEDSAKTLQNERIDLILTSPLMRTMQTTNIMNKVLKTKVLKDERLIEIDKGKLTGRMKESLTEEEWRVRKENPKQLGMETYKEIENRVEDFLNYVKNDLADLNVLIVTHEVVARKIESILRANEDLPLFKNAEIRKILV